MLTKEQAAAERADINAALDAAGYRDYEDNRYPYVVVDDNGEDYFTGNYENCKAFIRRNRSAYVLDIKSLATGRLVSYVL